MSDGPADIKHLVRSALKAQIELGTKEAVLSQKSKPAPEPKKMPTVTIVRSAESNTSPETPVNAGASARGLRAPLGSATFDSIESHCNAINTCMKCPLGATRNKFVYGVGNPNARLMFIGEAPGAQEDAQGEPFVGVAGQLLDKIMAAIQLSRKDVYIANILKCRPPNNRDPQPSEMDECVPYLLEQIRIIKPKLLCALGRVASQALLQTTIPLSRLRNQWHDFHGVPMLVTYHPAALLRFPANKRECWEDMKLLRARYDELG